MTGEAPAGSIGTGRGRARRSRQARAALGRLWSGILVSDPGSLRLRAACRTTLSVAVTAVVVAPLAARGWLPAHAAAMAVVLALMCAALPRDTVPGERLRTTLGMAATAAVAIVAAACLRPWPQLGQGGFLAILFAAVAFQSWGPRAVAIGLTGVVHAYLVLFLHVDLAHVAPLLLSLPVAVAVVAAVGFGLIPERPLPAARRTVRAVERQGAALVHASLGAAMARGGSARRRLRRDFGTFNETVLLVEEQVAAADGGALDRVSAALMRFELALVGLSDALFAAGSLPAAERAQVRLLARRLATGRRAELRPRETGPDTAALAAVAEVDVAAATLRDLAGSLAAARAGRRPRPGPRPGLAWRPAIRATAAALLSMLGGQLVSPDRWFWAVLTAYLVFLGARSSGEAIHKGFQRVWGTVAGLVAGVVVSVLLTGHPVLEGAALLVCVFGLSYVFAISQTLAIFCVTIMLGLIYSLIGLSAEAILLLRLEETAIGAAAAILVGLYLLPAPTHAHIRQTGASLVACLARVLRISARRLCGEAAASPIPEMRQADRLLRDLRQAIRPLRARSTLVWWARRPAELPAILACMFWIRVLAAGSDSGAGHADLAARVMAIADSLDGLDQGRDAASSSTGGDAPLEIGAGHIGLSRTLLLEAAVSNLESVVGLMRARFDSDGWIALVARRPL
ncbi:MAG: FUSC family protein [Methylobacterium frigidaeris]